MAKPLAAKRTAFALFIQRAGGQIVVITEAYHCRHLTPYVSKTSGDHEYGFQCNKSTTDHTFCICQILQKKWDYNEAAHQLFIDFKKAHDSISREILYNIVI
jgi:hypothetical protein